MKNKNFIINHTQHIVQDHVFFDKWIIDKKTLDLIRNDAKNQEEIFIGCFDLDGKIISNYKALPNLLYSMREDIINPNVQLVIKNNIILIKKTFNQRKIRNFYNEIINTNLAAKKINVSEIYDYSEKDLSIYKKFIPGKTIRDLLVEKGAKILLEDTNKDQELNRLSKQDKLFKILNRGSSKLKNAVGSEMIKKIKTDIIALHSLGLVNVSFTFGNIIINKKHNPVFIDFEQVKKINKLSPYYYYYRNKDISKMKKIYNYVSNK